MNYVYSGAQSSMGKIGTVIAKSSSTSIFLESTKVQLQKYLDIYKYPPATTMNPVSHIT